MKKLILALFTIVLSLSTTAFAEIKRLHFLGEQNWDPAKNDGFLNRLAFYTFSESEGYQRLMPDPDAPKLQVTELNDLCHVLHWNGKMSTSGECNYLMSSNKTKRIHQVSMFRELFFDKSYGYCFADLDQGLSCYSREDFVQTVFSELIPHFGPPESLRDISELIALRDQICILTADRKLLKCVSNRNGIKNYAFENPAQVVAGNDFICTLDGQKVNCFPEEHIRRDYRPPSAHLKDVRWLQVTGRQFDPSYRQDVCAVSETHITCWGTELSVTALPPKTQAVGYDSNYFWQAFDGQKIFVMDGKYATKPTSGYPVDFEPKKIPGWTVGSPRYWHGSGRFYLAYLPNYFRKLTPVLMAVPKEYLHLLNEYLEQNLMNDEDLSDEATEARYLALGFMDRMIAAQTSQHIRKEILPLFRSYQNEFIRSFGFKDFEAGLKNLVCRVPCRLVALHGARVSLTVASHFLSPSENEQVASALRIIGLAVADPSNTQKLKEAVRALNGITEIRNKIAVTEKAAFLEKSFELSVATLEQVK